MTVLGDGSQRKHLEQLTTDLQSRRSAVCRTSGRADIPAIYRDHDLFLNTSSIDNMPVAILEAFAAGLPIVTTDAGGIPHMIADRKNGHLVPIDDHVAVAERICELVANPDESGRLSCAGFEESRKYTREAVVPQVEGIVLPNGSI